MAMAVMEGIILSFVLLLVCVINIKDGPVGGVHYYEPPVQERVVELGLITKEQIKKNLALSSVALLVPPCRLHTAFSRIHKRGAKFQGCLFTAPCDLYDMRSV